jgi:hypothetical protein
MGRSTWLRAAGIAVTVIGVVGAILRFMTDTPAMKSN